MDLATFGDGNLGALRNGLSSTHIKIGPTCKVYQRALACRNVPNKNMVLMP